MTVVEEATEDTRNSHAGASHVAHWRHGASSHLYQPDPATNKSSHSSNRSSQSSPNKVSIGGMRVIDVESNCYHTADAEDSNSKIKPITIFGFDISQCNMMLQYCILAGGLLVFMCMYGYFQELVQYGWFDRKLSIFSTFLHFACCSVFAEMQRQFSMNDDGRYGHSDGIGEQPQTLGRLKRGRIMTMGTASSRVAFGYYFLLMFMKTLTQGFTNLAMTEINYPAKTLFKSANPIITMLIGIVWFRKTYPVRDHVVVLLLVLGLYLFINGDSSNENAMPSCTPLGIFYITVGMFGAASIPMIQEHCMLCYNATVEELLYHSFVGSALMALVMSVVTGEFFEGMNFLLGSGDAAIWSIFIAFCTVGFIGANFGTALTQRFGSLVNGITNTARKAVTLALSFLLFPERNHLTSHHILGAVVFFSGLVLRSFVKDKTHKTSGRSKLALAHSRFDKSSANFVEDLSESQLGFGKGEDMRAENVEMNGLDIEKKDIDIERNPWHEKINTASPRKKRGLISTYGNYLLAVGNGSTSEVSSSASSTCDTHEVTNDFGEIPRLLSNEDDVDGTLLDASNIAALNALEEDTDAPKSRNHISSSRNQNVRSQVEVLPSLLNELR